MNDTIVFSLTANCELVKEICGYLNLEPGKLTVNHFADGETLVELNESIRGKMVYLVQSTYKPVNEKLMELQQEVSLDKGNDRIGQEVMVMIEGKVSGENAYVGRTYGDAPKVDGYIFVQTGELLMTGDFARVRVTGALEYDLIGELADEYTE